MHLCLINKPKLRNHVHWFFILKWVFQWDSGCGCEWRTSIQGDLRSMLHPHTHPLQWWIETGVCLLLLWTIQRYVNILYLAFEEWSSMCPLPPCTLRAPPLPNPLCLQFAGEKLLSSSEMVCVCVCMGSSSERTTDNWVLLVFGVGTVTFSSRSVFFVQSLFGEKNLVCRGWGRKLLCYPPFLLHTWRLNSVWGFLNKKREIRYYSEAYLTQESKPSKEIKPTTLPLSDSLRHIVRNRFIFSLCLFSEVQILNLW